MMSVLEAAVEEEAVVEEEVVVEEVGKVFVVEEVEYLADELK